MQANPVPFARGAEKGDDFEQIRVRPDGVAIADQVSRDRNPEGGAAEHQEGPVETAAVERDEAVEAAHGFPELREKNSFGVADEREAAVGRLLLRAASAFSYQICRGRCRD